MAISDRTGISSPLDAFGFRILDASLAAVIVSEIIYAIAFDRLFPNEYRLQIAGAMLVAQMLLSMWALITRPALWSVLVAVALAIKLLCWTVSTLAGVAAAVDSAELTRILLRELVPYVAAISILAFSARLPHRLVCVVMIASSVLAGTLALTGEPLQMLDSSVRLSPITGGEGELGLHSSAYFALVSLFIVDSYRRTGWMPGRLSVPILGILLVMLVGYQVRTTLAMLGAYVVGHAWESRWRHVVRDIGLLGLGFAFLYAASAFVLTGGPSDIESWGSGRVGSYQFRVALLIQRDLVPLMFGSGPGSDAFDIPIWWGPKDSHSDIFHTLVEEGVVGFLGLAIFLYALWLRLDRMARPLLLSLLVCTAISNGLLVRPTEFFLLIVAMAVAQSRLALGNHSPTAPRRDPTPMHSASSRMSWAPADGRYRS